MTITFTDARAIVAAALLPVWEATGGTFTVTEWGWETETYWVIPAGAKEWLLDSDKKFRTLDDQIFLVDKATGEFTATVVPLNLDLLDRMTPYGDIPKDFQ